MPLEVAENLFMTQKFSFLNSGSLSLVRLSHHMSQIEKNYDKKWLQRKNTELCNITRTHN